jgi:type I restriction enzyme S subunit
VDQLSADADNAICDGPFGANLKTEHYVDAPGFRVIRLQNIGTGAFRDEHRAYIDEERFLALKKHEVKAGDMVVAGLVDASIRCCLVPKTVGPAIVKADSYRFSVHEAIDAEYVCLYLGSELAHEFATPHHHGLTLTRIGLGNFRGIPVPVPPIDEQRRIVARVTQLRSLCSDLRQRLTAQQTTQSRLAEALVESVTAAS